MLKGFLDALVLIVSREGWEKGRAIVESDVIEGWDDHPVQNQIAAWRTTPAAKLFPEEETGILGKPLGDDPAAQEFLAAVKRLMAESLDELEKDPATEKLEQAANIHVMRLYRRILEDPATKKLVMARKMSREEAKKFMKPGTVH